MHVESICEGSSRVAGEGMRGGNGCKIEKDDETVAILRLVLC